MLLLSGTVWRMTTWGFRLGTRKGKGGKLGTEITSLII